MASCPRLFGVKLDVDVSIPNQSDAKVGTSIDPIFHYVGEIDGNELTSVSTVNRNTCYDRSANKPGAVFAGDCQLIPGSGHESNIERARGFYSAPSYKERKSRFSNTGTRGSGGQR
jgi:hypothetical protein